MSSGGSRLLERLLGGGPMRQIISASCEGDHVWVRFNQSDWQRRFEARWKPGPGDYAALAETLEQRWDTFTNRYHLALQTADVWTKAEQPGRAATAYLSAANVVLENWSVLAASDAYRRAAENYLVNSWRSSGTDRVRELMRSAFSWLRAAQVPMAVSRDELPSQDAIDDYLTRAAGLVCVIDKEISGLDLPLRDVDQFIIERTDPHDEREALVAMCWTLKANIDAKLATHRLVSARLSPEPSPTDCCHLRDIEGLLLDAVRAATDGMPGRPRRSAVMDASASLAALYAHKLTSAPVEATDYLVAQVLYHSARVMMLAGHFDDESTTGLNHADRWTISGAIDRAIEARRSLAITHGSYASIAAHTVRDGINRAGNTDSCSSESSQTHAADRLHRLTLWGRGLAGGLEEAAEHSEAVADAAIELAGSLIDGDSELREDITLAAWAHDLFRHVKEPELASVGREHELAMDGHQWANPSLLHGQVATAFLRYDEQLEDELGALRFARLAEALDSHTVGPAPEQQTVLSLLLCIADFLHSRDCPPEQQPEIRSIAATGDDRLAGLVAAYEACLGVRQRVVESRGSTFFDPRRAV